MNLWLKANEHIVVFLIFLSDLLGTVFLVAEYFWGRPDIAVKNEEKQKKRLRNKHNFEALTQGEMK